MRQRKIRLRPTQAMLEKSSRRGMSVARYLEEIAAADRKRKLATITRAQRREILRLANSDATYKIQQMADTVGCSYAAAAIVISSPTWQRKELIKLRRRGLSLTAAADRLHMTRYTAKKLLGIGRTNAANKSGATAAA
jgi:hypothetical protein